MLTASLAPAIASSSEQVLGLGFDERQAIRAGSDGEL